MNVDLSSDEIHQIIEDLNMHINYMQTGDPILSANDVSNGAPGKIKSLDRHQMSVILSKNIIIDKLYEALR